MNEALFRLGIFAFVLALMMATEAAFPRRPRRLSRLVRWPGNFGVSLLGTLLIRLLVPASAAGVALAAAEHGWGLFNLIRLPEPLAVVMAFVVLDCAIYWQHRLFHRVPALWHLHRMHHTDLDIDVSTGVRFHPFELLLSMLIKLVVIVLTGAPATSVIAFEVLLNAAALFNHANLKIPETADRALRLLIVTPDMHRVHHSVDKAETNSNFGFFLSCWDHLFGSYIAQPAAGHNAMTVGLPEYQHRDAVRLDRMLLNPFSDGGLNRR